MLPYKDDPAIYLFVGDVILCKHSKSYLPKSKALLRLFLEFQFKGIQNSRESVSRWRFHMPLNQCQTWEKALLVPPCSFGIATVQTVHISLQTIKKSVAVYLGDFALQEQAEDKLMVAFFFF